MSAPPRSVAQTFAERRPAPALAAHVTCVWVQRVAVASAPYLHRTVPNGSAELRCALGAPPRVAGPQTGPTEEVLPAGTTVVGVRLRPGAAEAVFGVPAAELVDQDLEVGALWGAHAAELGETLTAAGSPESAARRLHDAVAGRLADGPALDPVAAEVVARLLPRLGAGLRVGSLASSLFISERQLRRRCDAAIGLAPKALHRMVRFQRFLALAGTLPRPSEQLARLAAEAGYADQSHLTRESLRLAGRSPRTVLRQAETDCGCRHDHAASYGPLLQG